MSDGPVKGELFRRNYLRPTARQPDSDRVRRRCLRAFMDLAENRRSDFAAIAERKLGVDYPSSYYGYSHEEFWMTCEVGDFLSSITLVFNLQPSGLAQGRYLQEVRGIFADEALQYELDDAGGVQYRVDEVFAQGSEAALAGLEALKFAAARHAFEAGLKALSVAQPSGKAIIRSVFEAAESAFLVIAGEPGLDRINDNAIDRHLRPKMLAAYAGVPNADDKVVRTLETLKRWVKSAHPYRHGAPFDQVHEAPLDEAILSASIGMGFIRYMAQLP